MSVNKGKQYETCVYWTIYLNHDNEKWGECRINPPTVNKDDRCYFPCLASDKWCGKWEVNAPTPTAPEWLTLEEFQKEANEGECWIFYKNRAILAYHDYEGAFRSKNSIRYHPIYITHAMPIYKPEKPVNKERL